MGMTIDEDVLVELFKESKMAIDKVIETIVYIASRRRNILNRFEREACANTIDIMRKYEKIQQILKDIPYGGDATVRRIQEVIEDGNDD